MTEKTENVETQESKEINMDKKVEIKNLCAWDLYFDRIETNGTVKIPRNGRTRLSRAEIQAQVYGNNVLFVGVDGEGSHARVFINDKDTRVMLGFDGEDGKKTQVVLDSNIIKTLLEYKTMKAFEKNVKDKVKTVAEKNFLIEEAKRQKLNDYDKISFIEEYTGYKFDIN